MMPSYKSLGPISAALSRLQFLPWVRVTSSGSFLEQRLEIDPSKSPQYSIILSLKKFSTPEHVDLQDVLLLYYTPWCGYCKAVQPVLLTVARFFQNMSDVIIARYSFRHNSIWPLGNKNTIKANWEWPSALKLELQPWSKHHGTVMKIKSWCSHNVVGWCSHNVMNAVFSKYQQR